MVSENDAAPEFTMQDQDGAEHSLSDYRGRKVVLYFYPKDDTPGCTTQACDIRDRWGELQQTGAAILGVSPDTVASHAKFRDKFSLPFTLLADPDHAVAEAYGVWQEKSMYGRKYMGVERSTFVIDEKGNVARVFPKVKPQEHVERLLEVL